MQISQHTLVNHTLINLTHIVGFSCCSDNIESACNVGSLDSWVRKIPWRREWLPTPVFLSGEFQYLLYIGLGAEEQLSLDGQSKTESQRNLSDMIRSLYITPVVHRRPLKVRELVDTQQKMHLMRRGMGWRQREILCKTQGTHTFYMERGL